MENNSTINNKIPQLRFPGFTGEWQEKKLNEVFSRVTRKNAENNQNVLTISAQYGLISQLEFFKKSVASSDVTGYYLLHKGEFAYNKSSSQGRPVGAIKPLRIYDKGVVSTLYICFKCNNPEEIDFWEQYFDAGILDSEILSIAQEGARNHGLLNISTGDFFGLNVILPTPPEMKKIAECLSSFDDVITAAENELDSLKAHKKGLMQQLFPQPGATTPALRFHGFEEFWEEKKLGDICDSILVGFPFKGQDITDNSSGHPILRAYSIGEGIIRHGKDYDKYYPGNTKPLERYKVSTGDIVISMDGSVGRNIALVSEDENGYLLIQRVARLRVTKYPVQLIYQQIISQRFKDYVAGEKVGAVIAHISQKQIESFPVFIPKSQQEQNKVADTLTETDRLISTQEQKVESLKTHKKGLMQQLFPQL